MEYFKLFKIDVWWKLVLWCGIALFASGLLFNNIEIINPRHLIGLGLGMFLIGLSFFIANKIANDIRIDGILSTYVIVHNTATRLIFWIGVLLSSIFGIIFIWNLI